MPVNIIDTHQHLWDPQKLNLPWLGEIPQLNRTFSNDDYRQYTACNEKSGVDYSIGKTLYVEVDVVDEDIGREIDMVLELCRLPGMPQAGLIASARPGTSSFHESLEFANSNPEIKGFRRVLHTTATPPGFCLQGEFMGDLKLLAQSSLPFDICIRRQELADVKQLASECDQTQFILDHCGNADVRMSHDEFVEWGKQIRSIAECDNVACKVSGFIWTLQNERWSYESDIEPILETVFQAFGEDRVLFGGDWPVCTLSSLTFQQWINSVFRFGSCRGPQSVEKIFEKNAIAIYHL